MWLSLGDTNLCHCFLIAGEYLALSGDKLNGVEMIACHLATHYTLNEVGSFAPWPLHFMNLSLRHLSLLLCHYFATQD